MQYILTIRPGIDSSVRKEIEEILKKHQYIVMGSVTGRKGTVIQSDITFMDTADEDLDDLAELIRST